MIRNLSILILFITLVPTEKLISQNPKDLVISLAKRELMHQLKKMIASQVPRILESEVPLDLDRGASFSKAVQPDNFSLSPTKLSKLSDLNRPLSDGDYQVDLIFYCSQWGHHRPSNGHPYKLARAKGSMSKPISALLFKGSNAHIPWDVLLGTAWAMQSGISYDEMTKICRQTVNTVIPEYKDALIGDEYDHFVGQINKKISEFNATFAQNFDPDLKATFNEIINSQNKKDIKIREGITKGLMLLNFRKLIMLGAIRVDNISQDQYEEIGGLLPIQLAPYTGNQLSEWDNIINPGVIGRFTIQGGFLKDNLLEFRVKHELNNNSITLNSILNGSEKDSGTCLIAYPLDANTEAQVPCLAADLKPILPEPGDVIVYGTGAHVAVITNDGIRKSVDGLSATIVKVRSKWGSGAIYDHDPNEVPDSYGQDWTIWRKKNKTENCPIEVCNSLLPVEYEAHGFPVTVKQVPYVNDYANSKIYLGSSVPNVDSHINEAYPEIGLSVHRFELPANRLNFDCRGFVFAERKGTIGDSKLINQTMEILNDGYYIVHGFDTGKKNPSGLPYYH